MCHATWARKSERIPFKNSFSIRVSLLGLGYKRDQKRGGGRLFIQWRLDKRNKKKKKSLIQWSQNREHMLKGKTHCRGGWVSDIQVLSSSPRVFFFTFFFHVSWLHSRLKSSTKIEDEALLISINIYWQARFVYKQNDVFFND